MIFYYRNTFGVEKYHGAMFLTEFVITSVQLLFSNHLILHISHLRYTQKIPICNKEFVLRFQK